MRRTNAVVAVLLLSLAAVSVHAAESKYPNRPIRFIVPFAAGGPSDILARMVGQKLSESLGQTLVVDNRGAVGGVLGFELGAKAVPDGYTILLAVNSGLTINPHVFKKLPYDPQRDFQPITQLTSVGNVVVVNPSVAAKNIQEFVALAKSKPGQLNYATTGTNNLLGIAQFTKATGINMVPIAYKGTGQAVGAIMAGEVQFFFMNPLVAIPHVKSGKLRAIAVTSPARNPALPDIATVAESGVPGFENVTWHNIVVPAKTPKPIVQRLNAELVRIVQSPDVKERLLGQGLTPVGSTPEEVIAKVKKESIEMAKLVKDIGYQPQ
ncbi:MAG: transporter substrate-binding protein [Burkholderiales bacterium]|jgi:tripartite-type tricarboxylate transporter receptor subunit TctC|nr:transporter substrate-binding protein [Burkholderiales bacterium]